MQDVFMMNLMSLLILLSFFSDDDECSTGTNPCGDMNCVNVPGSFICLSGKTMTALYLRYIHRE